jgi:hypothetical protein
MSGIRLPEKSFCGVEFGHRRWFSHLGSCAVCLSGWNDYKHDEVSKKVASWSTKCACGCGKMAAVGKMFYRGHSILTDEERARRSQQMTSFNPMTNADARGKVASFWRGRTRPNQTGDRNAAKRDDVRQKISDRNPMKRQECREKQRAGCLTENEVSRRSALMKKLQIGADPKIMAKRVDTYTRRLANGEYHLRNNWKTGWHIRPNGDREWYDSSYELAQMKKYDEEGVSWTKRHGIRIPYVSDNGMPTYYVPDFLITDGGVPTLVEVKGWMSPSVRVKALAAISYCKDRGMRYLLLLGKEMVVVKELSFMGEAQCVAV